MRYFYCPTCGGPLHEQEKNMLVCKVCHFPFYQNPVVGVATIIIRDKALLLGKRKGSYAGKWCIPCGYVDYDEDVRTAARRECYEETGLDVRIKDVYDVHSNFHNPRQHTVGIWFMAEIVGGELVAGDDIVAVDYFSYDSLPALAFPTDRLVIERLLEEGYI